MIVIRSAFLSTACNDRDLLPKCVRIFVQQGALISIIRRAARFLGIGVLDELQDIKGIIVIQIHSPPTQILVNLSLLLADWAGLPVNTLEDHFHHGHLTIS